MGRFHMLRGSLYEGARIVLVMKPLIKVLLQLLDGNVKLVSKGFPEEPIEESAVVLTSPLQSYLPPFGKVFLS